MAIVLFKKICYPSTVFAANDLNFVETLNTELRMSARSQVLNFPPPKNLEPSKVQISSKNQPFKVLNYFRSDRRWKSCFKCPLVMLLWVFVQNLKNVLITLGEVGFLVTAYFLLLQCYQYLVQGCQIWDNDLKFKMRGRIDTILMCVKFSDDPISSFDFSYNGGRTVK